VWRIAVQLLKLVPLVIAAVSLMSSGCSERRNIQPDTPIRPAAEEKTPRAKKARVKKIAPQENTDKAIDPHGVGSSESKKKIEVTIRIKKDLTSVKVRPEPSLKKAPIASLKGGDETEKIDFKGNWTKIRTRRSNGDLVIGWISNSAIDGDHNKTVRKHNSKPRKDNNSAEEQLSPM
jgi:hypothetical protein